MTKNRLFKSKRGEDMLVDFWAILIFALIVLIFLIIFSASKHANENKIKEQFEKKDAEFMLESFLRSPAIGVDEEKTVAEIISEDTMTDNFYNTNKVFDKYFKYCQGSNIIMEVDGENHESMKASNGASLFEKVLIFSMGHVWLKKGDTYDAETYIPDYNGNKVYVRLKKQDTITQVVNEDSK
jgi:hypothetical protein